MVELVSYFFFMTLGMNIIVFPVVYLLSKKPTLPPLSAGAITKAFLSATLLAALPFMWFGMDFLNKHAWMLLVIPAAACYFCIKVARPRGFPTK